MFKAAKTHRQGSRTRRLFRLVWRCMRFDRHEQDSSHRLHEGPIDTGRRAAPRLDVSSESVVCVSIRSVEACRRSQLGFEANERIDLFVHCFPFVATLPGCRSVSGDFFSVHAREVERGSPPRAVQEVDSRHLPHGVLEGAWAEEGRRPLEELAERRRAVDLT